MGGGSYCLFVRKLFIGVTIYPAALLHNISRGQFLLFKIYYLVWFVSRPLFTLGFLAFAMI
jgi:hypothetical protein